MGHSLRQHTLISTLGALVFAIAVGGCATASPSPQVTVIENGESKIRPEDCRAIIVGPGINQPDPFSVPDSRYLFLRPD